MVTMRNPDRGLNPLSAVIGLLAVLAAGPALAQDAGQETGQPGDWDTDAFLCRDLNLEPPLRIEACARALKAPSLSAKVQVGLLSQRAMAFDEVGDYDKAIQDYDAAIVLTPRDPYLYLNRGVAKVRGGKPAAALPDYDQAIKLKPDWHLPYFDRAVALSDLGRGAEALAEYQRAIERNPDDAWIYVGQGDVLAASGDEAGALTAYDHALALRPDLDKARARRAKVLLRLERPQDAVAEMDRALADSASNAEWWRLRAQAKFALADFAGAIADLQQAAEKAPQDTRILRELALAQLAAGDDAAADATAQRALAALANETANVILAGQVALLRGQTDAATDFARRAVALKPGDAHAQALLALSLAPGGESEKAAQAAADFAPDDAELLAIARHLGARSDHVAPRPSQATPAGKMLAACIANLATGDLAAARQSGARWSLCWVAAQPAP